MSSWNSYPKIYGMGHKYLQELLLDPVLVEEKVDGSQISFGIIDGELKVRSHHSDLVLDHVDKMFQLAVDTIKGLCSAGRMIPGWTYRGEAVTKPKHNSLAYDRIPNGGIILFDVASGEEDYLGGGAKADVASILGLEVVPALFYGKVESAEDVKSYLDTTSILGGQKIEGVVIKNYARFGIDKKPLMGKYVSEAFKEVHRKEWAGSNPGKGDIIERLISALKTPARWDKAIIHLRELGHLEDSPTDIGKIMKAVQADIESEEGEAIAWDLFNWAWPQISRGVVAGVPQWYKARLLDQQFVGKES